MQGGGVRCRGMGLGTVGWDRCEGGLGVEGGARCRGWG